MYETLTYKILNLCIINTVRIKSLEAQNSKIISPLKSNSTFLFYKLFVNQ